MATAKNKQIAITTTIADGFTNRNNIAALGAMLFEAKLNKGKIPMKQLAKMKTLLGKIDKRDQKIWDQTLKNRP